MEMLVSDADHLWIAAAQLLRAQVSEAVWLSTLWASLLLLAGLITIRLGMPRDELPKAPSSTVARGT